MDTIDKTGVIESVKQVEDYVEVVIKGEKYPFRIYLSNPKYKALAQTCKELEGQSVNYTLKKNAKGYWALHYVEAGAPLETPSSDAVSPQKAPDWDAKDKRIARESCIASASRVVAAMVQAGEVKDTKPSDMVVAMAKKFVSYVYEKEE